MSTTESSSIHRIRIGITGTRDYTNYQQFSQYLDTLFPPDGPTTISTIISGGARGADALAERYACERGIEMIVHPAEWHRWRDKHHAAYIRNKAIVEDSDQLVAFWNGHSPGTKMTIDIAQQQSKPVHIFRYDQV